MTIMKFFTPAWRDGELADDAYDSVFGRYEQHMSTMRTALPDELVRFIETLSLHDGLVRSASVDAEGTFCLSVRAGDLQSGYSDIDLEYGGLEVLDGIPSVAEVLNADDAEIVHDEIDVLDGPRFEHRLLFAPEGEVRIRFRQFSFTVTPAATRHFVRDGVKADPTV
jgi:hypothetical protein